MKNFFVMLFLLLAGEQMSAQKILADKVEENGDRAVITTIDYSGFRGIYVGMSSGKVASIDSTLYNIEIQIGSSSRHSISKGRKLLLKLSDNTIITLENSDDISTVDNKYEVIGTSTIYYAYPTYPLTNEQLTKICDNEVIKVRLEYDTHEYTIEIEEPKNKKKVNKNNNKFSSIIREAYANIQNVYKKEKNIYTDF